MRSHVQIVAFALACGGCFNPAGNDPVTATGVGTTTSATATASTEPATDGTTTTGNPVTTDATPTTSTAGTTAVSPTTGSTTDPTTAATSSSSSSSTSSTGEPGPNCGNDRLETGEGCDDGNNLDGDGCSADCEVEGVPRYVFVTRYSFAALELAPLTTADTKCKSAADAQESLQALKGREWRAWLSTDIEDALTRIGDWGGSYVLPDQTLVAVGAAQFASNELLAPINVTETGVAAPAPETCEQGLTDPVWTGTLPNGTPAVGKTCTGWTSDAGGAIVGVYMNSTLEWTTCSEVPCDQAARLYCIET